MGIKSLPYGENAWRITDCRERSDTIDEEYDAQAFGYDTDMGEKRREESALVT